MENGNFWHKNASADYRFIDNNIRDLFRISGVSCFVFEYLGTYDQNGNRATPNVNQIQDLFFFENRDRAYNLDQIEIKCIYTMNDLDFSLTQYGILTNNDTLFLEFHLNECVEKLGRKLIAGDVIRMPHLRDADPLNLSMPAMDKYYTVQEVVRSSTGYGPNWRPHLLKVKVAPITDSQEYSDIINQNIEADDNVLGSTDLTIGDILSQGNAQATQAQAIIADAENDVPFRNYQTEHLYVVDSAFKGNDYPWIFAGNGIPPNGAVRAGVGTVLPTNPQPEEWFLLQDTSYNTAPGKMMYFNGVSWIEKQIDYRLKWEAAGRILQSFINNDAVTTANNINQPEKQPLRNIVRPSADLGVDYEGNPT